MRENKILSTTCSTTETKPFRGKSLTAEDLFGVIKMLESQSLTPVLVKIKVPHYLYLEMITDLPIAYNLFDHFYGALLVVDGRRKSSIKLIYNDGSYKVIKLKNIYKSPLIFRYGNNLNLFSSKLALYTSA